MANVDPVTKLKLESLLDMSGGYILDLSNEKFAEFVQSSLGFDPYEKYQGDLSKARMLRLLWERESKGSVAKLNLDLLSYWRATLQIAGKSPTKTQEQIWQELVDQFSRHAVTEDPEIPSTPVSFTTDASVTANKIEIEIHEDIYSHIGQYLFTQDYFHAVEESYKLVREKLRDITGKEKASDVFNNSAQSAAHYAALFGKAVPATEAEADFFRGIGYLHLGVQHLRNEKAHTPATPLDPNLSIHYIALASLAYDLITRYVSEETIKEVEKIISAKRYGYRTASSFYRDFEDGKWMSNLELPLNIESVSVRKVLKRKWLENANFTLSWDHSNVVFMRLELVASELTAEDIEGLLDRPTRDSHGYDQMAGILSFLEYIEKYYPEKISSRVKLRIEEEKSK